MKRVLFNANVPFRCRVFLAHHEVHTVQRIGWRLKENGDLIRSAEQAGYDVLVSCDQNIEYQQNLKERKISIVILSTNKRTVLIKSWTAHHRCRGNGNARQLREG